MRWGPFIVAYGIDGTHFLFIFVLYNLIYSPRLCTRKCFAARQGKRIINSVKLYYYYPVYDGGTRDHDVTLVKQSKFREASEIQYL